MISFKSILKKISPYSDLCGYVISFLISFGLVLYFLYHPYDLKNEKEEGQNAISINLSAFAPPTPTPVKEKVKKKKKKKKKKEKKKEIKVPPQSEPSLVEAVQEEPEPEEKPVEEELVEDESNAPPNPDNNSDMNIKTLRSSDGIDDPYLRAIRNEVEKYNKYPRSAYNRRLSGEAMIQFLIKMDGSVEDIKLISSSKHDILDKAALKALEKAKKFFPKPVESVYIIIPISYALQFE